MQQPWSPGPILDQIRHEARTLLHGLLRQDTAALRRYHTIDPLADTYRPRLEDAQYVIAREHGYGSWRKLERHAMDRPANVQTS